MRARFTFAKNGTEYSKLHVVINRGAATWRSGPLGTTYFLPPEIAVRDLDADDEPEVVFDTYTGGAHCCLQSRIFRYRPATRSYAGTFHSWADVGYRLRSVDGDSRPEFVSADARFAYAFTAFAASFFPIQIWQYERGRVIDRTRSFPGPDRGGRHPAPQGVREDSAARPGRPGRARGVARRPVPVGPR